MRDVRDGTSQTIAVSEIASDMGGWACGVAGGGGGGGSQGYARAVLRWWQTFGATPSCKSGINPPVSACNERRFQFSSLHVGGDHTLMTDGQVRFLSEKLDANLQRGLTTRQGREVVGEF